MDPESTASTATAAKMPLGVEMMVVIMGVTSCGVVFWSTVAVGTARVECGRGVSRPPRACLGDRDRGGRTCYFVSVRARAMVKNMSVWSVRPTTFAACGPYAAMRSWEPVCCCEPPAGDVP